MLRLSTCTARCGYGSALAAKRWSLWLIGEPAFATSAR